MKYQAPPGSLDPNASYVDRSTPDAIQGSKVPAKAVEHPQREIVAVIEAAGLTPSEGSTSQLLQALRYFFAQFPIYPHCKNTNGLFDVTSPVAGTIRVPAGVGWVMRGAVPYTTVQTDLTTLNSKTYHLRWDLANGFRLRDLSDTGYNPGALAETNAAFDSTYDDMLVARVVSNGANVATITNLANLSSLSDASVIVGASVQLSGINGANFLITRTLNWSRTPKDFSILYIKGIVDKTVDDGDFNFLAPGPSRTDATALNAATPAVPLDRYRLDAVALRDAATALSVHFNARA